MFDIVFATHVSILTLDIFNAFNKASSLTCNMRYTVKRLHKNNPGHTRRSATTYKKSVGSAKILNPIHFKRKKI